MAYIASILGAAGNVVQGVGGYVQGLETSEAYKYNARLSELRAEEAKLAGAVETTRIKESSEKLNSTQRMMYAKRGVAMDSGSALDVAVQSQADAEMDQFIAKYNTAIAVRDYLSQAEQEKSAADSAKTSGKISLVGGLLGSAGSVAGGVSSGAFSSKPSTPIPTRYQ